MGRGSSRQLLNLVMVALLSASLALIAVGGTAWLLFGINACITETRASMTVASLHFQIEETDCSTLGEDASVSVYGSSEGERNKTLLFKYGPGLDILPTVEALGDSRLRISVQDVADVIFERHRWLQWSIAYQIGHIHYPRPADN